MSAKRIRWACPNGCVAVLGSSRPRKDDVARYCLACSAKRGRLVLRTAPTLENKKAAKLEREKAKAEAAKVRAAEREARKKDASEAASLGDASEAASLGDEKKDRPRKSGLDYVIQVDDRTSGDGTRTIATFGREDFAQAFAAYLQAQRTEPTARLLKVFEGGWVMSPILGYVMTYPTGKADSTARIEGGRFVIGWNRVEPVYRGAGYWRLESHETKAMLPGRTISRSSVRPFRRPRRRVSTRLA